MQPRLAGEHHVDVPWRPADLEQREGRIIRQGNQNDEVEILGYVVESSYDTVMWQRVEAKTLFIEQVRRNEVNDLEIEDLSGGDLGAAAAEAKALATGDPRYLRQVQLDEDVRRLHALERTHHEAVRHRDWRVSTHERTIPVKQRNLDELAPVAERAAAADSAPLIAIDGSACSDRSVAATRLAGACRRAWEANRDLGSSRYTALGVTVDGVEVLAARDLTHDMLLLKLAVPSRISEIKKDDLLATVAEPSGAKARGLLTRLDNMYADLPRHHTMLAGELDRDQAELADFLDHPPGPFEQIAELTDRQAELAALTLELRLASQSLEALAAAAAADERMKERGRAPGWTLLHNPTPYLVEESGFLDADSMLEAVRHRERTAALEWAQSRCATVGVDVSVLRAEVDYLDSAGGVSGAGMYPPPPDRYACVPEQDRQAVAAVAGGAQSVQVLTIGADADKAAALTAIAAAARTKQQRILALPATDTAKAQYDEQPYADGANTPQIAYDKFTAGQWTAPPGTLIVVDDADHLTAEQLHCFTENAVRTNTKLLLVSTPTADREPTQTLVGALATNLPWAQHIGTPGDHTPTTAIAQARRLADTNPELTDPAHRQHTSELLARADTLTGTYTRRLTHRRTERDRGTQRTQNRTTGHEL